MAFSRCSMRVYLRAHQQLRSMECCWVQGGGSHCSWLSALIVPPKDAAAGKESRDTGAAPSYLGIVVPLPAGMTLYALPPDIFVMESTPPPTTGSSDRDTMLCSMVMHCAAASTVSLVLP